MAKKRRTSEDTTDSTDSQSGTTNTFSKGMLKDYNETFVGEGLYTHARNAVNNSHDGQVGVIGNEPSNIKCVTLPYDLIGSVHTFDDQWVVFTTNDVDSEIGIFDESQCSYTTIVNDKCLNFKRSHLITAAFRYRYDCERIIYWDDALNPSRTMDIDDVPYKYTDKVKAGCIERTYTTQLDCEAIRMASLVKHPCIKITRSNITGSLPNGSYQACIAYTINKVRVTDYIGLSEVQGLFTYQNVGSAFEIKIVDIDKRFDEFELVILSNINSQTICKRIGYYSTVQGTIYIDRWDPELPAVPLSEVVLRNQAIENTDAMYSINNYLIRIGTHSKFKFNYQKQANKIRARWVAVEYPVDYYVKGGNNTGYMRDEQYPFFIRWIYNTGERSESYHIPGRKSTATDTTNASGPDAFEMASGVSVKTWQVSNTASVINRNTSTLPDGGVVLATGSMGYWESKELYPADRRDIWGDLCGQPIRHHKMPDETVDEVLNTYNPANNTIVLLGVQFDNISHPLGQDGNPIDSIVGYEILRGSREGNKSILGKGIFNNMREYKIPENDSVKGLYQNYPYNDLRSDVYLTSEEQNGSNGDPRDNPRSSQLSGYRQDVFSFHSPEVSFTNVYLNVNEVKLYQELSGTATGSFSVPYLHPKLRLISNRLDTLIDVFVTAVSIVQSAATAIGDFNAVLESSNKDLPATRVGVGKVLAEGVQGTLGQTLQISAIAANVALRSAYTIFFGAKVQKQQVLDMVLSLIPFRQYAAQYNSHGFYNAGTTSLEGNRRRKITNTGYVGSSLNSFTKDYLVNNVLRSKYVILKTEGVILDPAVKDNSRFSIGQASVGLNKNITSTISTHYGALKLSIGSQYGQLESIKQFSISECIYPSSPIAAARISSPVFFGGDTYINRFTEKNTMFFFKNWLMDDADGVVFDYTLYPNLPYPRYWVNSTKAIGLFADQASEYRSLDKAKDASGRTSNWYVNSGYFYLFNSGVRDFFCESEINLAYRDWEDEIGKRHYDPYEFTDISSMFRSDVIKNGNYYKYDYSLSISKLVNSAITWGDILPRDYDPLVQASCYVYKPLRVIYSLPQQYESKKDSLRVFLANNYYDFESQVTSIKSINKTGALFMMRYTTPMSFMGVEELQLDGTNTKLTVGDGKLFNNDKQLQAIVNVDDGYEYASCQSMYSAINTLHGVFWVSQNQGKIFNYMGRLDEISNNGMKWWFSRYLPSQLLKTYPDYALYDNPLAGVGVQTIYDNVNEIVYFTKKDYRPLRTNYTHDADGNFYIGGTKIQLTDERYFEDASWTISYDPKSKTWISFHDWIPTFLIPGKQHFMSVKGNSVWKHNVTCTSYCNFYGVDYPFEIEFVSTTGQTVNTMRSIEYLLEAYYHSNDCRDKFHILDENFDQAIIHNSEQISGLLNLKIKTKNNPLALLQYPKINFDSIDIQFSKEENKYRFNQFWDITSNRGEYVNVSNPLFNIEPNGYKFSINSLAVNYTKDPLQHKKFRHVVNKVFLRKTISNNVKLLFKISNQKSLQSYR
jgi:hypothetical protein